MRRTDRIFQTPFLSIKGASGLLALMTLSILGGALVAFQPNAFFYLTGFISIAGYILLAYSRPFVAFTILVFFALTVLLSSVKVAGNFSALVGLGLLFSLTWVSRLVFRTTVFVKAKEYRFLIGLSVTVIISALYNLANPAGFSSVPTYLQLYLLFVLVVNVTTTPSRLRALGGVIIISSSITAILILLDQFSLLPPGLIVEQSAGVQVGASLEVASRTGGLWGDANFTAVQLITALPFIIGEWTVASAWWKRAILGGAAGAILAAFSFTLSIGGLLGLFALLLIKAILAPGRNIGQMLFRVILILVVAVVMFYVLFPDLYIQRALMKLSIITTALDTQDPELLRQAGSGRGDTWQAALGSIAASPLLGHGPGNGSFENVRHSVLYGTTSMLGAHNMFLSVGADLGLSGLALFSALLVSAILAVRPFLSSEMYRLPMRRTGEAIFIALLVYVVQGAALDIHSLKLLWLLLGMAISYKTILTEHPRPGRRQSINQSKQ